MAVLIRRWLFKPVVDVSVLTHRGRHDPPRLFCPAVFFLFATAVLTAVAVPSHLDPNQRLVRECAQVANLMVGSVSAGEVSHGMARINRV